MFGFIKVLFSGPKPNEPAPRPAPITQIQGFGYGMGKHLYIEKVSGNKITRVELNGDYIKRLSKKNAEAYILSQYDRLLDNNI